MAATLPKNPRRPTGITVLIILYAISLILTIALTTFLTAITSGSNVYGATVNDTNPLIWPIIFALPILVSFIMMVGLLYRKPAARKIIMVFAIIGIVVHLLTFNILGFVVDIVILWYISQSHVKNYFGIDTTPT